MCQALSMERHLLLRHLHSQMCYKCSYPQQMLQTFVHQILFQLFTRPKDVPTRQIYLHSSSWPCVLLQVRLITFQSMRHQCVSMNLPFSTLCSIWAYITAFWTLVACPDESKKSRLSSPSMSCSIQLFIPASWETTDPNSAALNRRAELWGEIDSPAGTQYFFPTIGFVSSLFLAPASWHETGTI